MIILVTLKLITEMKRILAATIVVLCTAMTIQAQDIMVVELNDSTVKEFYIKDINQIFFRTAEEVPNDSMAYLSCPDEHHPHLIDLGLPSGTKWACCNIGAHNPEGYGGYYAWGETEAKENFDWDNYLFYNAETGNCDSIAEDISGSAYDVAHILWGGSWRMPSLVQFQELIDNCTREENSLNNENGFLFTGPNGGAIFLPAAGGYLYENCYYTGKDAYYWTSSLVPNDANTAYSIFFRSNLTRNENSNRFLGYSVRAVCP